MNELITPELSDRILDFLVEKIDLGDYEEFKSHDFPAADQIGVDATDVLIDDLRGKGLIEILARGHSGYDYAYEISLNKTAIDFQRRGGFKGQETLLRQNLEKLVSELNGLTGLPDEQTGRIRAIVSDIREYLVMLK